MAGIDASLRRLGMDYVDLYQIHRWDYDTPIEVTLEALHDVVKAGKARYIGASSMFAWQFCKALYLADLHGWTRFVTMQDHYNLLHREEEREMLPLCAAEKIAVLPWSPLARGRLARAWDESTPRWKQTSTGKSFTSLRHDSDRRVVERVGEIAQKRGVPRAQVALAWLLHKPVVTAPIVGASKQQHLDDAIAAVSLEHLNRGGNRRLGRTLRSQSGGGVRMTLRRGARLVYGSHAFIHPLLEPGDLSFGPGFVAGHAAVLQAGVNRLGMSFDVVISRQIHAELFHRVNVGSITKQRANIFGKAESHQAPPEEGYSSRDRTERTPTGCPLRHYTAGAPKMTSRLLP